MKNRILSLALALTMCLSLLPMNASAADTPPADMTVLRDICEKYGIAIGWDGSITLSKDGKTATVTENTGQDTATLSCNGNTSAAISWAAIDTGEGGTTYVNEGEFVTALMGLGFNFVPDGMTVLKDTCDKYEITIGWDGSITLSKGGKSATVTQDAIQTTATLSCGVNTSFSIDWFVVVEAAGGTTYVQEGELVSALIGLGFDIIPDGMSVLRDICDEYGITIGWDGGVTLSRDGKTATVAENAAQGTATLSYGGITSSDIRWVVVEVDGSGTTFVDEVEFIMALTGLSIDFGYIFMPDPNFRRAVQTITGKHLVTSGDVANITHLDLRGKEIQNLTGIKSFTSLE